MLTDFKTKHRQNGYKAGLEKGLQDFPGMLNTVCEWGSYLLAHIKRLVSTNF